MEEMPEYRVTAMCEPPKEEPQNVSRFRQIVTEMADLYARKNLAYGDSFHTSIQKYGFIAALTRISDKFNRLENLILNGGEQNDETLTDTIMDMASYCIMAAMEIDNNNANQ